MIVQIVIIQTVTPSSFVGGHQRFGETAHKMEASCFFRKDGVRLQDLTFTQPAVLHTEIRTDRILSGLFCFKRM
jgi:hypothetical protein